MVKKQKYWLLYHLYELLANSNVNKEVFKYILYTLRLDETLCGVFCETQWSYSVKTRLYNTPPPDFIL